MARPIAEQPHMPSYGVGKDDWEPLPWSWAAERLINARNFWVVTVSNGGRPHALPVWGVWDDDALRFGFFAAPDARKVANMRANPQVVITGPDTVEAISIEGRAVELTGTESVEPWIRAYIAKYGPDSVDPKFLRSNASFEVIPERAFGVIEREDEFSTRATRWRFP